MPDSRPARSGMRVAAAASLFELRLQLRSPVFWIVVAISALMVTGSLTVERIQVGPLRTGGRTTPEAILYVHLVWSLFFLFTAAALMTETALRDEVTGFGPIVRTTPASPRALALGRFGGSVAAVLLSFASVPLATALAPHAPWAPAVAVPSWAAIGYGTFVLAIPNLLVASGVFFALATVARSPLAAYLGAVGLLVLYGLGSGGATAPEPPPILATAEPFGFAAYRWSLSAWPEAERAGRLPTLDGPLLWSRLAWLALGGSALAVAIRGAGRATSAAAQGNAAPALRDERPTACPAPAVRRAFGARAVAAQLAARTRMEIGQVGRSPILPVLLCLGIASGIGALWPLPAGAGLSIAVPRLDEAFRLVPIVVATFYAGELVWRERDTGTDGIVGAAPIPDWALLAPKVLALALVLGASLAAVTAAAAGLSAILRHGVGPLDWLAVYGLPRAWDAALVAALAVFLQAVAPNKLAGFGLMVLYLISALALESAGLHGDLYRYGGSGVTLAPANVATGQALLVRAYWGAAALLLLVLAHLLVGRGVESRLGPRLRRLPGSLRGTAGCLAGGAALLWLSLGLVIALRP